MRQKNIRSWLLGVLLLTNAFAAESFAQHTRMTNPNSVGVEGLGRGIRYSIFFDRAVSDDLVAGIGYGSIGSTINADHALIPFFMNYYLNREGKSVYVTAGASWLLNGSAAAGQTSNLGNMAFPVSGVIPNFGIGYESRVDQGFLFRIAAYGMITTTLSPWLGFTFGYSF